MAKYPLQGLLSLREHRIDAAVLDQSRAKSLVQQAVALEEQKRQELVDYKKWCEIEVENRYHTIFDKNLTQTQLEKFKQGLSDLKLKEMDYEEAIVEAQKQVIAAKDKLEAAKLAVHEATLAKTKLDEHRKIWMAAQRVMEERMADAELEDFHVKKN